MIVIAGPRSTITSDTVCDCCFAVAMTMAIAVVVCALLALLSTATSRRPTNIVNTSFSSLHRPHVFPSMYHPGVRVLVGEGLSW